MSLRQPRRNRCVFSCKMRLGFISNQNLHVTPAHPGEIVVFFNEKSALYQPPRFLVFSQVKRVLRATFCKSGSLSLCCLRYIASWLTSQCEFTCDAASPSRMPFLFPRENVPRGIAREVSKLEQRHMLTKE